MKIDQMFDGDLIAMRRGYSMEVTSNDGEWITAVFTRTHQENP